MEEEGEEEEEEEAAGRKEEEHTTTTCNSIGTRGHRTEREDASRFCPLPLMTECLKQDRGDGIGPLA